MEKKTINNPLCIAKCKGCTLKNKAGNKTTIGNTTTQNNCPVISKIPGKTLTGNVPGTTF